MPKIELKPPGVRTSSRRKVAKPMAYTFLGFTCIWWIGLVLSIILASFALPYLQSIVIDQTSSPKTDERSFHNKKKTVPKRTPLLKIFDKELPELIWDQDRMEDLILDIVHDAMPLVIKKVPKDQFAIFHVDLMNLAESGFHLNVSRWQNQPLFITSHERERGGMIGAKNDKYTLYSNVTMVDFLRSVMNQDSYFSWTGSIKHWESQIKRDELDPVDLAAFRHIFLTSDADSELGSEPSVHFAHPGVILQTNYDTAHTFMLQIMGEKTVLLFPHSADLHSYPNIHRSYSHSQIRLEAGYEDPESFPGMIKLSPFEVKLSPGDMLYIPAYWFHREECQTLSLSMSMRSRSSIESVMSSIYMKSLPLGLAKDNISARLAVVELYLRLVTAYTVDIRLPTYENNGYKDFLRGLYTSRFLALYPPTFIKTTGSRLFDMMQCPLGEMLAEVPVEEASIIFANKFKGIQENLQGFIEVAKEVHKELAQVDNLYRSDIFNSFLYDYTEELLRWAIGPETVVVYIYKCSL